MAIVLPALTACSGGGVAVYDPYDAASPIAPVQGSRSAMRLTRWQLTSLVAQAGARAGLLGASIDRVEGSRAVRGAPGFS